LNRHLYFAHPVVNAVAVILLRFSRCCISKWQYFILHLPKDYTVLLKLAALFHLMHIRVGSWI